MVMASFTATTPSLATLICSTFSPCSVSRASVAVFRLSLSVSSASASSSISASRSAFLISRASSSMFSSLASFMRKSRSLLALPSSVSQKPFLVASASDSASSLSMSSWMRPLILSKGSLSLPSTLVASADRTGLPRRPPSFFSMFTTCTARSFAAVLTEAASCTKARASECAAMATLRGWSFWRRARAFTCASRPFTLFVRTSRAPARAPSSSRRMEERWSQSLARSSHCFVRSLR
mmetsp:Transcript_86236/g.186307  ORF Transcript_86236/g.186307 Transcript_86236/m.186307 type:complete len:237 (-) Transcript_86236:915-1625(-)